MKCSAHACRSKKKKGSKVSHDVGVLVSLWFRKNNFDLRVASKTRKKTAQTHYTIKFFSLRSFFCQPSMRTQLFRLKINFLKSVSRLKSNARLQLHEPRALPDQPPVLFPAPLDKIPHLDTLQKNTKTTLSTSKITLNPDPRCYLTLKALKFSTRQKSMHNNALHRFSTKTPDRIFDRPSGFRGF